MDSQNHKKYLYGYSRILPLNPQLQNEKWEYSLQLHKNQNGKHFDLRFRRPGDDKALSWAMKKIPGALGKPTLAMRTHDHNLAHMDFAGPLTTAAGFGTVQLLRKGSVDVKSVDENGIHFVLDGMQFRLRPYRGRRYMFEQINSVRGGT